MLVLLSHIAEEKAIALALKEALEHALPGLNVWASSSGDDVPAGTDWNSALAKTLRDARAIIALCSNKSISRPWINFECGFGHARNKPVIPVCHSGLSRNAVPQPLGRFQALDLRETADCGELVNRLANYCKVSLHAGFDPQVVVDRIAGRRDRTSGIGICIAHGQDSWAPNRPTLFDQSSAPAGQSVRLLRGEDRMFSADLSDLSGLIVGSPWRCQMSEDCIAEIDDWVQNGGRLLLLGYELGDRHHKANLGSLARCFGFHPMPDIVGPPPVPGGNPAKPYAVPVEFDPKLAEPSTVFRDLGQVVLTNVQTVVVEPGGTAVLLVGRNAIYRPAKDVVVYHPDGTFSTPGGGRFLADTTGESVAVAAEAPAGLCGRGAALFLGTWDVLSPMNRSDVADRLYAWLSLS